MVLRDIIEAHPDDNINIVAFSRFSDALLARTACPVTINKIIVNLRRRGYGISYYRTRQGYEVDFVAVRQRGRSRERELYQVCYTLEDPDVREREIRAITKAAPHLKATRCCIITFNSEERIDRDGVAIDVIPAWKWLLIPAS